MNSMNADQNRIDFLLTRDTPAEVLEFARMAARCYRGAALASKRKHGHRGAYRQAYVRSYQFHKRYVKEHI
jgi:hypothetical protein